MVNLLPKDTQRSLVTRYYLRLGTTLEIVLSVVFFIGAVLLIPSYFASQASADSYERYRDALEGAVGLKERSYVSDSISRLAERVRVMSDYGNSEFTASLIDALGNNLSAGISVTDISFTRSDDGATVSLGGTAGTREDLLVFVESLKESSAFSQVTLPVAQLVVEEDVSFSIKAVFTKQ